MTAPPFFEITTHAAHADSLCHPSPSGREEMKKYVHPKKLKYHSRLSPTFCFPDPKGLYNRAPPHFLPIIGLRPHFLPNQVGGIAVKLREQSLLPPGEG